MLSAIRSLHAHRPSCASPPPSRFAPGLCVTRRKRLLFQPLIVSFDLRLPASGLLLTGPPSRLFQLLTTLLKPLKKGAAPVFSLERSPLSRAPPRLFGLPQVVARTPDNAFADRTFQRLEIFLKSPFRRYIPIGCHTVFDS